MYPVTKNLVRVIPKTRTLLQHRNMTVISGPPTNRMPFTEKVAHGVAISVGVLAIPFWVLFHLQDYKGHK